MRLILILWLVILSDGVGALVGARAAWRMKDNTDKHPELALAFWFGLSCYAIAAFGSTYNAIANGPRSVLYPEGFLWKQIAFRLLQTVGIWVIALTLMNGRKGMLRTALSKLIGKFS